MSEEKPRDRALQRAAEALRFMEGKMSPEDDAAYRDALEAGDEDKYDAVVHALTLAAVARARDDDPDDVADPELCEAFTAQLPRYLDKTLSRPQRRDLDEHLERCHDCHGRLAELQKRPAPSEKTKLVRAVAVAVLLVALGGVGGWVARPVPTVGVQEDPLTGRNAVFSDAERIEFGDADMRVTNRRQLATAAVLITQRVPVGTFLRNDLHRQARADLKTCLAVLGRAAGTGAGAPGTKEWIRSALLHPDPLVRREAAIWYPKVDRAWDTSPELKSLVAAARQAAMRPTPAQERPDQ